MKKLLAILLTLAVLCSVSVCAFAADTDTMVFTWEDVAEDLADIDEDGAFHQVGDYVLWLPSFFEDQELSDERLEQGYIANIMATDESAAVIAFTDTNEEGADLEVLAEAYTGAGLEAEVVEVNGKPAMLYVDESSDTLNLLFLKEDDNTAETVISFYPLSDEGFSSLAAMVLNTVQPGILWSTVEEFAAMVDEDADFYQIGDYDLAMWIPSPLGETELTDEDIENGYIAYLMTDDGEDGVSVTVTPAEGVTLKELKEFYEEEGIEGVELGLINGIPVLTYTYDETDSMNALFMSDDDEFMQVSCWPASDDNFSTVATLIMSSIQVIE